MSLNGDAWASVQFQNANNSIRVTDDFMRAAIAGSDYDLMSVTEPKYVVDRVNARDVLRDISQAAWECGDPGMQYDTTINDWHTCANTGPINASNPCSEYMHVDNSACNLASINLLKFLKESQTAKQITDLDTNSALEPSTRLPEFDVESFRRAVEVMIWAQEIIVGNSSYPTPKIEANTHAMRQLGLGYANLGALLMSLGLPYDSDEGRAYAGAITAIMTGHAYAQSAVIASRVGPFDAFRPTASRCCASLRNTVTLAYKLREQGPNTRGLTARARVPAGLRARGGLRFEYPQDWGPGGRLRLRRGPRRPPHRRNLKPRHSCRGREHFAERSRLARRSAARCRHLAWDDALALGEQNGYRNAQATVLAPTGTIAFMMDCDTTGVEPDIALVKYKKLVGGGMIRIVNQTVPRALARLGYAPTRSKRSSATSTPTARSKAPPTCATSTSPSSTAPSGPRTASARSSPWATSR